MLWIFRLLLGTVGVNVLSLFLLTLIFPERIALVAHPVWLGFLVSGVILGMINTIAKPVLRLLSLPLILFTFGFFLLVINALSLWLLERLAEGLFPWLALDLVISGGFFGYLIFGTMLAMINALLHKIL